jgi:pimeloyl-ACP methyl ester carboxylesterase
LKQYLVNDGRMDIHITEWGKRGNPVIICLHGLGATSLNFIQVAEMLKGEYNILSFDAPGHGKTPPFKEEKDYELPNLALWLNRLMNTLKLEHFYLLSHSWGSSISLYYLKDFSYRVNGCILIDGGYQTKSLSDLTMEEEMTEVEKDFEEYVFDTWDEYLQTEKLAYESWSPLIEIAVKDMAIDQKGKIIWHARGTTAKYIIKGMHTHETIDIYEKLPQNIILLRATMPERLNDYRLMTSTIFSEKTGAVVKAIENTSHLLHWEKPEVVVNEIRRNWL